MENVKYSSEPITLDSTPDAATLTNPAVNTSSLDYTFGDLTETVIHDPALTPSSTANEYPTIGNHSSTQELESAQDTLALIETQRHVKREVRTIFGLKKPFSYVPIEQRKAAKS